MKIECNVCGSRMKKKNTASSAKWIIGLLLFLIGIACLPIIPVGTVFGFLLMWLGNNMQKGKKYYLCANCGHDTK